MRKKREESKITSTAKGRKSNRETFTVAPGDIREIRKIAGEARLPVETVFQDVVENGLQVVPNIYKSLIEYRKTLAGLRENESAEVSDGAVKIPKRRNLKSDRKEDAATDREVTPALGGEEVHEQSIDDDDLRPGHESEANGDSEFAQSTGTLG